MNTMQEWLDAYGVSHKNPTNKALHWVCVPVIFVSLIGLLSILPLPRVGGPGWQPYLHAGTLLLLGGLVFFARLSTVMAITMGLVSATTLYLVKKANLAFPDVVGWIYLGAFSVAWVGQFIGHKIEGQKPSFFDDIKFLLVGPAWLAGFVLRRLNIRY